MPNILHRISIDAPPERVQQLAATREGIQRWWTGHPVTGDDKIGAKLSVYWAAYLMSLKSGAEGRGFNAYPSGEISRWD